MSGFESRAVSASRTVRETWARRLQNTRNDLPPAEDATELVKTYNFEERRHRVLTFRPGDTIAGYTIMRELGAGGIGKVYLAHSPIFGRKALKVSSLDLTQEAFNTALLSGLRYKTLAKYVDSGTFETQQDGEKIRADYLTTEVIEGETLHEMLYSGPLPRKIALEIGHSIAKTTGLMHDAGLVHCDIKPSNVIIDKVGEAVLFDYGLARKYPVAPRKTGTVLGTPLYMSPEQLLNLEFGPPTDVFAMGVSLWEVLTNPNAEARLARFNELIGSGYSPLPPLPRRHPNGLQDILNKATARNPEDRYPDGHALAQALAEI